jgi:putative transcriptional regulator
MSPKDYTAMSEAERDAAALAEMQADLAGGPKLPTIALRNVSFVDVRALRKTLGMTQEAFASAFGFSVSAVRNWEQARRLPDRSTRILLNVIAEEPERVQRIAREAL